MNINSWDKKFGRSLHVDVLHNITQVLGSQVTPGFLDDVMSYNSLATFCLSLFCFQYYIKIVPTTYARVDGSLFLTSQVLIRFKIYNLFLQAPSPLLFLVFGLPKVQLPIAWPFNSNAYALQANRSYVISLFVMFFRGDVSSFFYLAPLQNRAVVTS